MSTPTTPEARAELRELLAATASPGKWVALGNSIGAEVDGCTCGVPGAGYLYGHEPHCGLEGPVLMQAHEDDAKLIAAAVNALPALLDAAEKFERAAEDAHNHWQAAANQVVTRYFARAKDAEAALDRVRDLLDRHKSSEIHIDDVRAALDGAQ